MPPVVNLNCTPEELETETDKAMREWVEESMQVVEKSRRVIMMIVDENLTGSWKHKDQIRRVLDLAATHHRKMLFNFLQVPKDLRAECGTRPSPISTN